jgi:iron-sulfur cluster assembly accessory protein
MIVATGLVGGLSWQTPTNLWIVVAVGVPVAAGTVLTLRRQTSIDKAIQSALAKENRGYSIRIRDGDFCVENRGVQLLVDPMSAQYLMGAEIDYKEDLQGAQFVIRNPNAKTTCGCGSSFSA